jgi:hypothetical protein
VEFFLKPSSQLFHENCEILRFFKSVSNLVFIVLCILLDSQKNLAFYWLLLVLVPGISKNKKSSTFFHFVAATTCNNCINYLYGSGKSSNKQQQHFDLGLGGSIE